MHSARNLLACVALSACISAAPLLLAQEPAHVAHQWAHLAAQPATHSSFTFDRSAIQSADSMLEQDGMNPGRAAAAISRIIVDSYHYAEPAFYPPETMDSLRASYDRAGWRHLVNANKQSGDETRPSAIVTDLWLHFVGADIDGVNVMLRGPRDMHVIQLAGDLRPLDLLHLSGHFGIPKIDPDAVMVPEKPQPQPR